MNKEIYLIRHGRTEYNKLGIWQGSGVDSSLDSVGNSQANNFYNLYKNINFDLVIHSGLRRTKETVRSFIEDGIEVKETATINEISWGHFEGKPHTDESIAAYTSVVKAWSQGKYEVGFPGGESASDLSERLSVFVEELKTLTSKKILVCSHGRAIRGLMCVMQGLPMKDMEKFEHANTGLFQAIFDGKNFVFSKINDVGHL